MTTTATVSRDQKMSDDFEHSKVGDKRIDKRVVQISKALSAKPEKTFPEVFGSDQEVQNAYRLFNHDWLTFEDIIEPHLGATARRCQLVDSDISVIHDTTEFSFPVHDDEMRQHLSRMSKRRQGFFGHGSLAIVAGSTPCPLGYLAYQPFVHDGDIPDEPTREFWENIDGVMDNELARWMRGVRLAEQQLDGDVAPLHIFDSEGDAYQIHMEMKQGGHRYLTRMGQTKRRVALSDGTTGLLDEVVANKTPVTTRRVWVSKRTPSGPPRSRKPARSAHEATLEVRSLTAQIVRPDSQKTPKSWPAAVEVNIVHLLEVDPPAGEEAVEWFLATTEPIATEEQVDAVIDRYQNRWLIEENNKSIKTGCGYTKRQLRSATALLNVLAITLPVSLDLLRFRYLSRAAPEWPAEAVVTERQLEILQRVSKKITWSETPTVAEATMAVAKLGGFLKRNKVPGWQTLGRGYQTLLEYEIGWAAAQPSNKPYD